MSRLPETYFIPGLYDLGTPGCLGWPGCVYFIKKKRGKVDNNLSIKRKLILFASIASQRMLFLFAFFFWGFPLSHVVLNFISLHSGVLGYCVYMDKLCPAWPGSRLLQPESRSGGTSRSPYKRNCKNNSKLLTSRDPGIPGHPAIPRSYKQALNLNNTTICALKCLSMTVCSSYKQVTEV